MPTTHQLPRPALSSAALLLAGLIGGCTPAVPAGSTPAPTGGPVTVRETRPNTARGSTTAPDENISAERGVNDPNAAGPQPPPNKQPPGTATRGGVVCIVHFDNRTRLYIDTYVDRSHSGTMRPYGDLYAYAVAGPTRLYARAPFTNGDVWTWGPVVIDCPAGSTQTWRLW